MAIILEQKKRNVIPNWRKFEKTLLLGELGNSNAIKNLDIDISRTLIDWKNNKTIGIAADLLNSAFISNKKNSKEVSEAALFVIKNQILSNYSLTDLAKAIIKDSPFTELNFKEEENKIKLYNLDELQESSDPFLIFKKIHDTKFLAFNQNRNPIIWVELARLYASVGQEHKALQAMEIALNISPSNRFVLRSATRLFVHFGVSEKALYYLKKSESIKFDPWLISAHIATSTILKRYSPFIKDANKIILSKNFSDFDLTELTSSLGTLEYFNGSLKDTKKLFNLSLKQPNDNSLAQIEWVSNHSKRSLINFELLNYKNVIIAHEAYAIDSYERGLWDKALENTINWVLDIPYSKTPVILGSYIACCLLDQFDKAIELCKFGLKANPNDPILLNNLIYSLTLNNEVDKTKPYIEHLEKLKRVDLSEDLKTSIKATLGLVAFREKNIEFGKRLYKEAIEESKDERSKFIAIYNYLRELIFVNDSEKDILIKKIKESKNSENDVKYLKQKIEHLYMKFI
jgi:tetratricopeptide (TPR) repeat protein